MNSNLIRLEVLETALSHLGIEEISGAGNNPVIVNFFELINSSWFKDDSVPWCAAFVGAMLELNDVESTRRANARSYQDWGSSTSLDAAQQGDVVVLWRKSINSASGHVGFYVNHDDTYVYMLGGNQRDSVSVQKFLKTRVVSVRKIG